MNYFPQTAAGAIAQYPVQRTRQWRWISNQLESGEMIMLPDAPASQIGWKLTYTDLSVAEVANIQALFDSSQGQYGAFLFVDPMANLVAWSEDYAQPNWQPGQLSIAGGAADPLGTTRAASVKNAAAAQQSVMQTLNVPGSYVACFSVWARSDSATSFALLRDATTAAFNLTPAWTRYQISGTGTAGAAQSAFSIAVGAGQTIQIFGPQVEAQPAAASYKQTTTGAGIYPETYFAKDELQITSTGPGLFAVEIDLISRVQS